jgi:hypothetical protein
MIWTAIAIFGASVSVFMTIATIAGLRFAEKSQHLEAEQFEDEERCPELYGTCRCELERDHSGPHKRTSGTTVSWWEVHAPDPVTSRAHADAAMKLARDMQNAAPGMYAEETPAFINEECATCGHDATSHSSVTGKCYRCDASKRCAKYKATAAA